MAFRYFLTFRATFEADFLIRKIFSTSHFPNHYFIDDELIHSLLFTKHGNNWIFLFVQKTIREQFADCTTFTIAHRLNTIMDSSRFVACSCVCLCECLCVYVCVCLSLRVSVRGHRLRMECTSHVIYTPQCPPLCNSFARDAKNALKVFESFVIPALVSLFNLFFTFLIRGQNLLLKTETFFRASHKRLWLTRCFGLIWLMLYISFAAMYRALCPVVFCCFLLIDPVYVFDLTVRIRIMCLK